MPHIGSIFCIPEVLHLQIAFDDFLSWSFLHSLFDFFNQLGGSNILYYHEVPVLGSGGQRPLLAEASAEKQRVSSEHEEVRGMKVRWWIKL